MDLYLLGRNGHFYNMEEVGEICFGDGNESQTVSLIHRANGINCGKGNTKKGLYRPGCKFEQTYGYRVTRRDIEDFIRQYESTGSAYQGVTFEDWLIERALQARQRQRQPEQYAAQTTSYQLPPQNAFPKQELQQDESGKDNIGEIVTLIAIVIGIILIIVFRKQIWAFLVKVFVVLEVLVVVGIVIAVVISLIKKD